MSQTPIDVVVRPISKFIHQEYTSGIVLFLSVVAALFWANSPGAESYHHVWETSLSVGFAQHVLITPYTLWINDGLMAVFLLCHWSGTQAGVHGRRTLYA
ncbi:Na+/H+ antiporter NhaA [Siphonobacter sp. BAB-5405]|uniref:Na+/H+ antiporter NhaA n=1 Tax=Siphonobacter sp. BAB-5405 TaxID=1864825 RepID=UPI0018ECD2F0|nr:Na+/H+ antiporter NhaA [Siphonobacter sp. BAB-5405]